MSIRMTQKESELIDKSVNTGMAMNRSDFVRQAIRDKLRSVNSQTL